MKNNEKVIPIYASSFFSVSCDGEFHQLLQYDYYDPEGYYSGLEEEEFKFTEEIKKLWVNMQSFLEDETNKINGKMVYPKVKFCDIQHRTKKNPYIIWVITFKEAFQKGINLYETKTDEEKLEYNCYVIWQFSVETRNLKVDTKLYYDIFGNRIILWGEKGMMIGGYERIRFEIT